jgi:outer membrane protein TolC
MWQANQALLLAEQQIRNSYLSALTARAQIDTAAYGVDSAREALRLAQVRLKTGVGTNLELIQAQRDFIAALIAQATAISDSNAAQTQLLHDTGLISVDAIVKAFFPDRPFKRPRIR